MATRCLMCGLLISDGRGHECRYWPLRAACGDTVPSEAEDRILRWLAGFDRDTVDPIAALLARVGADRARAGEA